MSVSKDYLPQETTTKSSNVAFFSSIELGLVKEGWVGEGESNPYLGGYKLKISVP